MANKSNYFPRRSSHFKNYKVILSGRGSLNKITWDDIPIHLVSKGYYTVGVLYITEQKMMQDALKELDTMERLNPTRFAMRENKRISERIERYKKFKEVINEGN